MWRWTFGRIILLPLSTIVLVGATPSVLRMPVATTQSVPRFPLVMTYTRVLHGLGPWLARKARVPIDLPAQVTLCTECANPLASPLDVGYQLFPDGGFHLAMTFKGAVTTRQGVLNLGGGADDFGTVWGLPVTARWQRLDPMERTWFNFHLPKSYLIMSQFKVRVLQPQDGKETCWASLGFRKQPACQVVWHQDRWLIEDTNPLPSLRRTISATLQATQSATLANAQHLARSLAHHRLPGRAGRAAFSIPTTTASSGSAAMYVQGSTRYIIGALGEAAGRWAESMKRVPRR